MREIYVSNYLGRKPILDSDGFQTGEYESSYSRPVKEKVNIGMPSGYAEASPFGTEVSYDQVIVAAELNLAEGDRIWFHATPPDDPHNYVVTKVAHSLNFVLVAIKRVEVSDVR